ncbi:TRAP transporter substrate-binding protein [Pelosinus propionicus]|uniref:Tripartite ATP-independent transporter solute receptor, DctP family n=1 Tax=Pelosinus propionicus DSM 13327 TaxID=1123291 RepID=A0A1I4IGF0_9FIRM|nr:TRAP transporter substrate-binding protein [Pelosinus propionicus]SFL53410.1 tripartite ATP-independent transporter solute receptor, DctP family [Pelosinus propionicus DSM 13327]
MKRSLSVLILSLLCAVLLTACSAGASKNAEKASEGAKVTIRLAEAHPADYPTTEGDKKFAELVKQATNGRINVEVYPGGTLGDENSVVSQVQSGGTVDMTRVSSAALTSFNPQMGLFALPYLFKDSSQEWTFLNSDKGQKLLKDLQTSNMMGLAYYESGARSFYSSKPLTKLSDLKGQKIRVQQSAITLEMVTALGANPIVMPYGDVFGALQTGTIDAAENNAPSFDSANHYTVAKNYILDGHQRVPEILLISLAMWNKLSPADQKIIQDAATASVATEKEAWAKYEEKSNAKIKAAGVTITTVDNIAEWQEAVKPIIEKNGAQFKDLIDYIHTLK